MRSYHHLRVSAFVSDAHALNTQAIKKEAEGEQITAGDATENGEKEAAGAGGDPAAAKAPEGAAAGDAMEQDEEEDEDDDEAGAAMMPVRGPLPPQDGSWASCIRLVDPVEGATVECLELGEVCCLVFSRRGALILFFLVSLPLVR